MSDTVIRVLQQRLNRLGFGPLTEDGLAGPATRLVVARFQLAYNLGSRLVVDGLHGPATFLALDEVEKAGKISPNFSLNEVRSKGNRTAYIHRDFLSALETLRSRVGRPLALISAYRDEAHNRRVGGARSSQHTYGASPELEAIKSRFPNRAYLGSGRAADFNQGYIRLEEARTLGLFSGLGHRNGWVTHADLRLGVPTSRPTVWQYG